MKLLAIGVSKEFKTWSIPVEEIENKDEKPKAIPPEDIANALYKDDKGEKVLPRSITLIKVNDGIPVVQGAWRFVNDEWEGLDIEPDVYPRPESKTESVETAEAK